MAGVYRTIAGDWWDDIARRTLGSEYYMDLLMDANPEYIDVARFGAGITLRVPDRPTERAASLPPWKRR
jgi:phage tail protein X